MAAEEKHPSSAAPVLAPATEREKDIKTPENDRSCGMSSVKEEAKKISGPPEKEAGMGDYMVSLAAS